MVYNNDIYKQRNSAIFCVTYAIVNKNVCLFTGIVKYLSKLKHMFFRIIDNDDIYNIYQDAFKFDYAWTASLFI